MDISEQTNIIYLLQQKGFKLEESTPKHLRLERHSEGDHCWIEILFASDSLPVSIRWNGQVIIKIIKTFDELKTYLEEQFS